MEASKNRVSRARASQARLWGSIMDAVMPILGTTPARRAWLEAASEILWEYDRSTALEMAWRALECCQVRWLDADKRCRASNRFAS